MVLTNRKCQLIILAMGGLVSALFAFLLYRSEFETHSASFQHNIERRAEALHLALTTQVEALHAVAAVVRRNPNLDHTVFTQEANRVLLRYAGIQAIEWVPKVNRNERNEFENVMRAHYPDFTFTEVNRDNTLVQAKERDVYYPVYFIAPHSGNESALGFDLSTNDQRLAAINQAIQWGKESLSVPLTLVQEHGEQQSVLMVIPIFRGDGITLEQRMQQFVGAVIGVFRMGDLYLYSEAGNIPHDIKLELFDVTEDGASLLYARIHDEDKNYENGDLYSANIGLSFNRNWQFVATPSDSYFTNHILMMPLAIMLVGTTLAIVAAISFNKMYRYAVMMKCGPCELQNAVLKDPLTNLFNRRHFNEMLTSEWRRAIRNQTSISMLVIDIDQFKAFNDRFGHVAGDNCLIRIAQSMQRSIGRSHDIVFRYGGEEFALLLPETTEPGIVAERCRANIQALAINQPDSPFDVVTVSIGCATLQPKQGDDSGELFMEADRALYEAKATGRNRVCEYHKRHTVNGPDVVDFTTYSKG